MTQDAFTNNKTQPAEAPASSEKATNTPRKRSLIAPFTQAGTLRIADLGFDASESGTPSEIQIADDTSSIYSIPGERIGHISYGYEGERWRIRNLVWVVAQSPTGMQLIESSYKAGYRLNFDSMATPQEFATPAINPSDKVILLDSRAHPVNLVCMLIFHLAIADAALAGICYDSSLMPPDALVANRMSQAYARAALIQTAYELRNAQTLPEHTNRDAYWQHIEQYFAPQMDVFNRAALNNMALRQGTAMASTIREFYNSPAMLYKDDHEVINYYRSLPGILLKDAKTMTARFDPLNIAYKLELPGMSYAMTHEPKLDPAAPEYRAAPAPIVEAVAAIQQQRRTAGIKDRTPWQIMVADL